MRGGGTKLAIPAFVRRTREVEAIGEKVDLRLGMLLLLGCRMREPDSPAPASAVAGSVTVESKRIYRCEWSPLIDEEAESLEEVLNGTKGWRVVADGVSHNPEVFADLVDLIEKVPPGSEEGVPFCGFNEHFLLCEGDATGRLIGFTAGNHGIMVWEMEVDEEGRWQKAPSGSRLGTEEEKTAVRALLSKAKFRPLSPDGSRALTRGRLRFPMPPMIPDAAEKRARYAAARERLHALWAGEPDAIARMAGAACVLHESMPHAFWTGFYRVVGGGLVIGPYQGTPGCSRIGWGKGVCGTAWASGETQVVPDVHAFPGHIACDGRAESEIVVPVKDGRGTVVAVFDVDSAEKAAFDEVDREELEKIFAGWG